MGRNWERDKRSTKKRLKSARQRKFASPPIPNSIVSGKGGPPHGIPRQTRAFGACESQR